MHKQFGYCRVGAAVPVVCPGAVNANIAAMAVLAKKASEAGADVLVFPELCVTGYTCADLFFQPNFSQPINFVGAVAIQAVAES